jgi:acetamidase/formamidase
MSSRKKIFRERPYNYVFDAKIPPKLSVKFGEEFEVETEDAASGTLKKAEDSTKIWKTDDFTYSPVLLNPINGPIYIEGVERGDVVLIHILDVIPGDHGWTAKLAGFGHLAHDSRFPKIHGKNLVRSIKLSHGPSGTTSDGKAQFPRDDPTKPPIEWDLAPFFGTIALAPDHEVISSLTGPYIANKGSYGGNWDSRDVKKGSTVWLQAYHEGGLFFVGDLHASQGDGEWGGVANESPGLGAFKCTVLKDTRIPYPRIDKEDSIIQLNNGRPLERVLDEASIWMMHWLIEDYGFDERECYDFLATCPDFRYNIYQTVPPDHYTVGAEISKKYLK